MIFSIDEIQQEWGDEEVGGCSCEKAGSGYLEKFEIFCVTQGEGESEISPSSEPTLLPPDDALSRNAVGIQAFYHTTRIKFPDAPTCAGSGSGSTWCHGSDSRRRK